MSLVPYGLHDYRPYGLYVVWRVSEYAYLVFVFRLVSGLVWFVCQRSQGVGVVLVVRTLGGEVTDFATTCIDDVERDVCQGRGAR